MVAREWRILCRMTHPLDDYEKVDKPWGSYEFFMLNEPCSVKFLHLLPGKRLSLQRHAHREEFWRIARGSGIATIDGKEIEMKEDDELLIKVGTVHRFTGGPEGATILEITIGTHDEADIERLEDDFGRK